MGHMQERIIALQGEMDRVITFKGNEINSDVIHGTDQRFTIEQLKTDLTVELENAQGSIAAWKQEVIHGDKMKIKFSERKVYKIEQLKGRQAAYADFINQGKRTQKFNKYVPLQPASKRARRHCGAQSHWWSAKTLVERKPWWSAKTLVERRPWWSTSFASPADPGVERKDTGGAQTLVEHLLCVPRRPWWSAPFVSPADLGRP
jgi:hypothetical protein